MTNNRIMSLDQATISCGYSIFEEDGELVESGRFMADKKEKNITSRIEKIYTQIYNKSIEQNVKYFVFEDTFNKLNIQVTKNLCWLQGAIMQMSFINDYGFVMYYPSSWRSKLEFKRKNKKNNPQLDFKNNREYAKFQAIEYVNKKYNMRLEYKKEGDDDIAEAICIGLAYLKDKIELLAKNKIIRKV